MALSSKHYAQIAQEIAKQNHLLETMDGIYTPAQIRTGHVVAKQIAEGLARNFAADNPRFDTARFLAACRIS